MRMRSYPMGLAAIADAMANTNNESIGTSLYEIGCALKNIREAHPMARRQLALARMVTMFLRDVSKESHDVLLPVYNNRYKYMCHISPGSIPGRTLPDHQMVDFLGFMATMEFVHREEVDALLVILDHCIGRDVSGEFERGYKPRMRVGTYEMEILDKLKVFLNMEGGEFSSLALLVKQADKVAGKRKPREIKAAPVIRSTKSG